MYLETLDQAAFAVAGEVLPKLTSHSDPASLWKAARKSPACFSDSDGYLIEMGKLTPLRYAGDKAMVGPVWTNTLPEEPPRIENSLDFVAYSWMVGVLVADHVGSRRPRLYLRLC